MTGPMAIGRVSIFQNRAHPKHLCIMPGLATKVLDLRINGLYSPTGHDLRDISEIEVGLVIGIRSRDSGTI